MIQTTPSVLSKNLLVLTHKHLGVFSFAPFIAGGVDLSRIPDTAGDDFTDYLVRGRAGRRCTGAAYDLTDLEGGAIARATTDATGHFTLSLQAFSRGWALTQDFALGQNYQCVEWTGELVYANEGLFGLSVGFKHLPGTFRSAVSL